MSNFKAGVQYNDWRGTVAGDDLDRADVRDFLRDRGILEDGKFMIGMELFLGEPNPIAERYITFRVFVVEAADYEGAVRDAIADNPIEVESIEIPIGIEDFFKFFKRFNLMLTHRGLDLEGREYREIER